MTLTPCQAPGVDPAIFFPPEGKQRPRYAYPADAKHVCQPCPHKNACIAAGQGEWGVWGGQTQEEREGRARPAPEHGKVWTYTHHGCRCAPCTTAWRAAVDQQRRHRAAVRGIGEHGYNGYTHGCRCDTCTAAKAAYMRDRRERGAA